MKIKLCTFFSDSHRQFYKLFMNSFPYEDGVDLVVRYLPQDCSGTYNADSWNVTMRKKVGFIVDYLSTLQDDELLIHSDIDVVFYRSFKEDILWQMKSQAKDILFQNDGCALCMGFFVCNNNPKVLELMKRIYSDLDKYENDQVALNMLIGRTKINFNVLPNRYYSFGACNGNIRLDIADNLNDFSELKQKATPVRWEIAGFDTFIFKKSWYCAYRHLFHDYLLGKPEFDHVYAGIMRCFGDNTPFGNQYPPFCFHIHHGMASAMEDTPERSFNVNSLKTNPLDSIVSRLVFFNLKHNLCRRTPWGAFLRYDDQERNREKTIFTAFNVHTPVRLVDG